MVIEVGADDDDDDAPHLEFLQVYSYHYVVNSKPGVEYPLPPQG